MTLPELKELSQKELRRLKKFNAFSYHSCMLASIIFLARAFSEINPLVLMLAFGCAISAYTFYSNVRTLESLKQTQSKS